MYNSARVEENTNLPAFKSEKSVVPKAGISAFFVLFCWVDEGEVGFVELGLVDWGRGVHHKVDAGAVVGEGDDVADIINAF